MLTAEDNIVLPLSIAGERPEPEWVDEVVRQVGAVRSSLAPAVGDVGREQQRIAVAGVRLAGSTILFADEPTGNWTRRPAPRS